MKRLLLVLGIRTVIWACASLLPKPPVLPGVITVYAQSLPITRTVAWDANPASDGVTNYVVRLDNVVIGSPTTTSLPFTITTAGTHTLAVRAVNLWAESPDSTLVINVIVPAKPTGLRLQ
jgi:hypothetical protein